VKFSGFKKVKPRMSCRRSLAPLQSGIEWRAEGDNRKVSEMRIFYRCHGLLIQSIKHSSDAIECLDIMFGSCQSHSNIGTYLLNCKSQSQTQYSQTRQKRRLFTGLLIWSSFLGGQAASIATIPTKTLAEFKN